MKRMNRSKAGPPQSKSCTESPAMMRLMGFIPASMCASVVPSNPNDFKITKVNTTPLNHADWLLCGHEEERDERCEEERCEEGCCQQICHF
jgi:hypothetical protein